MTRVTPARTLAVIAARGGSKGIPHKNLIDLCGKPLIAWPLQALANSPLVDELIVAASSLVCVIGSKVVVPAAATTMSICSSLSMNRSTSTVLVRSMRGSP